MQPTVEGFTVDPKESVLFAAMLLVVAGDVRVTFDDGPTHYRIAVEYKLDKAGR